MGKKQALGRKRVDRESRRHAIELAKSRIEALVARSQSFASLSVRRQARFLERVGRLITAATGPDDLRPADRLHVDYPVYVADLIEGVFQAIVDASIRQMEAYVDLVRNATNAVDEFVDESRRRQQLLATMVLMGISRIEVGTDRIVVRPCATDDD